MHNIGTIYILKCGKYFKIGFTANVIQKRIHALQTGNPYDITLVRVFEGNYVSAPSWENKAHKLVKRKRIRGEWFALDKYDLLKLFRFLYSYEHLPSSEYTMKRDMEIISKVCESHDEFDVDKEIEGCSGVNKAHIGVITAIAPAMDKVTVKAAIAFLMDLEINMEN